MRHSAENMHCLFRRARHDVATALDGPWSVTVSVLAVGNAENGDHVAGVRVAMNGLQNHGDVPRNGADLSRHFRFEPDEYSQFSTGHSAKCGD